MEGKFLLLPPLIQTLLLLYPPVHNPPPLVPEEVAESAVEHSRDPKGEISLEAVPRMSHRVRFAQESEREDKFRHQYSEPLVFPIKEARRALHLFSGCSGLVEESLTLWVILLSVWIRNFMMQIFVVISWIGISVQSFPQVIFI